MKARDVREILGVTQKTLNTWVKNGTLHPFVVNDHHYEYDEAEVFGLINKKQKRVNVTYARVSLPKQRNDLKTQNERLYDFATRNGFELSEQIEDIKSGMEFKNRKGFRRLIDLVTRHKVDTVIVENKDRLVRFGFDLVSEMFKRLGTNIVVMSDAETKTYEQELTDDLISIIHYYSMKSYGNRHRKNLMNAEKALKEA